MMLNLIAMLTMLITMMMLFMVMILINMKMKFNYNKSAPFECGFDPFNKSRIPFSLNFYLIAIIFLIFDIEISIILPMIMNFKISNMLYFNLMFSMFFMFMIITIFYEWKFGSLNWKI
ncbi:NADH dehydrogenase subunit 3 (mitochondrion) [Myzus persicae]|uniref:NADH-ubiquinone oxidoreductase chain 3 n=1 Tax=Myzus persicae TaxID=13164 RepID=A0A140GME2_MYZPE|nr:NADH dehydrogenase subunit 3 [Myzus persicae]AMN14578.1 NADH dehydrogenase subunit 3 [Myzus persicae]ANH54450.1 NADH dehydrogenase subunit 3 [Myzus persicae]QHN90078.1 NADH dehydrogenase subunit 3 [Myzus persicae]QOI73451.1 NADH dehydrogenase subunit 3 [Myzus persicae]UCC42437.1 NADH dehydrogenase subunit 3 [Myzus persicae]